MGQPFLKTELMSAIFNPVIIQVLLNGSAKVSEQLSLLALKIFGGIFPNVLAFLYLDFLTLFQYQTKRLL